MPELPEVETIRRALQSRVEGAEIITIDCRAPKLRFDLESDILAKNCIGKKIIKVTRRAKYLLFLLESDGGEKSFLAIHLGMSGQLLWESHDGFGKHDHVIFITSKGEMRLRDPRRFGYVFSGGSHDLSKSRYFRHLGIEPLDANFDGEHLEKLCANAKRPIKNLLMDAGKVVGIGNIYANEALYSAGVSPFTPACELDGLICERLATAIKKILREAIKSGGSSMSDYRHIDGKRGYFQHKFAVYKRDGEICKSADCRAKIVRKNLQGRGTFYCPQCQAGRTYQSCKSEKVA